MSLLLKYINSKPLYYEKIDYDLMPKIYAKYKHKLPISPVIHIIGTNGKGSTGRWLALMLKQSGFKVGHFTSPHIREYNERFWLDGLCVSYDKLDECHEELLYILGKDADKLSYFEYSTLLVPLVFEKCDFVVLEAGLGGEFDATNVYDKILSIVTAIGFDHEEFLGNTLESITKTKLNSITTKTILAYQNKKLISQTARKIANSKGVELIESKDKKLFLTKFKIKSYMKRNFYADFFYENIKTAFIATQKLKVKVDFTSLPPLDLGGRLQKIRDNIYIDVGHNPLSAEAIKNHFKNKKLILIYNSFADKDIVGVLSTLKPIVLSVNILPFNSSHRKNGEDKIIKTLNDIHIPWKYHDGRIENDKIYLVFGSFYVIEEFLSKLNEK